MGDKMGVSRKMLLVTATVGALALTLAAGAAPAQESKSPADRPPDAIVGTRGGDTLVGAERRDYIDALRGDDTLVGHGSGDMLRAGEGDDLAVGGGGDDYFVDAEDGRGLAPDVIGCGADHDTVLADAVDRVSSDCEVVR